MEEEQKQGIKGGRISPEEEQVWQQAMLDVKKLERSKPLMPLATPEFPAIRQRRDITLPSPFTTYADRPIQTSLEKRQAKKLKQGKISIDAKIDLHGFTEAKAHEHLLRKIDAAYHHGKRCVLVITGKGHEGKGVLAQRVPLWLGGQELKGKISRIAEALPQHGGSGALYVFLRGRH